MAKRIKITAKNYHTPANPYLSNSKISLFLKSKEAFKAMYIDRTLEHESTPSLLIGRAVDLAFEKGRLSAIDKEFVVMDLKQYRESDEKRIRLTEDQMEKAKAMATKILKSDMYKYLCMRSAKFQQVFIDEELGFAGMLDAIVIDDLNKSIDIIDLKTSAPMAMKSKRSWFYHCLEYSYFNQFAGYAMLVSNLYPEYAISCVHIVIGSGDYYPVKLFSIDMGLIVSRIPWLKEMINTIKNNTDWEDKVPGWDEIQYITDPNDEQSTQPNSEGA